MEASVALFPTTMHPRVIHCFMTRACVSGRPGKKKSLVILFRGYLELFRAVPAFLCLRAADGAVLALRWGNLSLRLRFED